MKKERTGTTLYWGIIIVNLTLFVSGISLMIFHFNKYAHVNNWKAFLIGCVVATLPAILSGIYLVFRIALEHTCFIKALIFIIMPFSLASMLFIGFIFNSQTSDIKNYLQFDDTVELVSDYEFFPEKIPESAENTEYFYRYVDFWWSYDIYLKVKLSESDFEEEKLRIGKQYPEAEIVNNNGAIEYRIKYYDGDYFYKFVSFSEQDLTVTYICSYSVEGYSGGDTPYFEEIAK
ncbi:MAG: hypothetical protein LBL82_07600 [Oscillospiraceae bacterium]|jgi:hypothetical protein|nr:hypothetical protein [Oscillospiraceae bacterium]